jgi:hypothetical protein
VTNKISSTILKIAEKSLLVSMGFIFTLFYSSCNSFIEHMGTTNYVSASMIDQQKKKLPCREGSFNCPVGQGCWIRSYIVPHNLLYFLLGNQPVNPVQK